MSFKRISFPEQSILNGTVPTWRERNDNGDCRRGRREDGQKGRGLQLRRARSPLELLTAR